MFTEISGGQSNSIQSNGEMSKVSGKLCVSVLISRYVGILNGGGSIDVASKPPHYLMKHQFKSKNHVRDFQLD